MQGAEKAARPVILACYLGWTLDAFDFFIMAFTLDDVARSFGVGRATLSWGFTLTLLMRPLGALMFGRLADRFGRRPTLMANVVIYSALEGATGFAPNLGSFLLLRALYGIAMGGEWGVGASLTMESVPVSWRGRVSGLLQTGYPTGFLLATLVWRGLHVAIGWRGLFMVGVLPALLVSYIRRNVPESPDWQARVQNCPAPGLRAQLAAHPWLAVHTVLLMAAFNFLSHGTQDLYKSFLSVDQQFADNVVLAIVVSMNIGAILGGLACGAASQRFGRRRCMVIAALAVLPIIPLWAFARDPLSLGIGAFMIQICVQGAWGVVPAHLNEISPPSARATFPGLAYQLGNLLAAGNATLQSGWAKSYAHDLLAWPLAGVAGAAALSIAILASIGGENRRARLNGEVDSPTLPE